MGMKLLKNKILVIASFLILISSLLIIYIDRNKVISDNIDLEQKISNDNDYAKNKYLVEGRKIWEITYLTKGEFANIIKNEKISDNFILVFIDTAQCGACLENAVEKLTELRKNNFKIIGCTHNYNVFLKDAISTSISDTNRTNFIKNSLSRKFIVAYVDLNGRIIYADFPSPKNYIQSSIFYDIVKRYKE